MDRYLLELVWGVPASVALPSAAACRRALERMQPRLLRLESADARRRQPGPARAVRF